MRARTAAWIVGSGETDFGALPGEDTFSLMARAADEALTDARLERQEIDGLLCGYSTTVPLHRNNMLASVFCEYYGLHPSYVHGVTVAGGTGAAMVMLAAILVESGQCGNVLVVTGENRRTGRPSDETVAVLTTVGEPNFEAPFGPTIPAYFALVASTYMREYGITEEDIAEFSVLMRAHAAGHPRAHRREPISVADVLGSRPIASPFKLLDCCQVSDGAAAVVVSATPAGGADVRVAGSSQVHPFQHLVAAPSLVEFDAAKALDASLKQADMTRADIDLLGIYDSFSFTVLAFIEDLGLVGRGEAAAACRDGMFGVTGRLPLNTHGGLMSFGHSGAAGGLTHVCELYEQLAGKAGERQVRDRHVGVIHGEGGIFSSQIDLVLVRE